MDELKIFTEFFRAFNEARKKDLFGLGKLVGRLLTVFNSDKTTESKSIEKDDKVKVKQEKGEEKDLKKDEVKAKNETASVATTEISNANSQIKDISTSDDMAKDRFVKGHEFIYADQTSDWQYIGNRIDYFPIKDMIETLGFKKIERNDGDAQYSLNGREDDHEKISIYPFNGNMAKIEGCYEPLDNIGLVRKLYGYNGQDAIDFVKKTIHEYDVRSCARDILADPSIAIDDRNIHIQKDLKSNRYNIELSHDNTIVSSRELNYSDRFDYLQKTVSKTELAVKYLGDAIITHEDKFKLSTQSQEVSEKKSNGINI